MLADEEFLPLRAISPNPSIALDNPVGNSHEEPAIPVLPNGNWSGMGIMGEKFQPLI